MSRRNNPQKTKSRKKKTSTEDFLSNSTAATHFPLTLASEQILRQMGEMVSKLQHGNVESMFAPLPVTPAIKKQIRQLPVASTKRGSLRLTRKLPTTEPLLRHSVFLVDKEKGSNGLPLEKSNGISMNLAMAADISPNNDRTDNFPVLLGAIASACLEPMKKTSFAIPAAATGATRTFPSRRPGRLLLDSSGTMEQLRPSLQEMGITNLDVSDAALIQSISSGFHQFDQPGNSIKAFENLVSSTSDREFRQAAAETIRVRRVNVTSMFRKQRQPMYGWTPPEDSSAPKEWFICPPPIDRSFRLTELWGWRTNLERAILQADVRKG